MNTQEATMQTDPAAAPQPPVQTAATDPWWVRVELWGNATHYGIATEAKLFGTSGLQIDALEGVGPDEFAWHFFQGKSLFSVKRITEAKARDCVRGRIEEAARKAAEESAAAEVFADTADLGADRTLLAS